MERENIATSFYANTTTGAELAEEIAIDIESRVDHYSHKGWPNETLAVVAAEEYFEATDAAGIPHACAAEVFRSVFPCLALYL